MGDGKPTRFTAMEARLSSRIPIVEDIMASTGQPGVSIGVLFEGDVVFKRSLGYRNVKTQLASDGDTLYCIASLTKAFITASLSILVQDGKINWNDKVCSLVPQLRMLSDSTLDNELTVVDLVSHRSGLISLDHLIQGLDGKMLAPKENVVGLMNELPKKSDIRTEFSYTNLPFSIAGEIIERHGGCGRWDNFLKTRLLSKLGMHRTTADWDTFMGDDHLAQPYVVRSGREAQAVDQPQISSSAMHGCSGGIRSSVNEMLKWAQYMLGVCDSATSKNDWTEPITRVLEGTTIIDPKSTAKGQYCLGWVRQATPATLGMISPNRRFASPVSGAASPSRLVYSHNGDVLGYTSSLCLFPRERAAIVVLSNGTGLSDCTDWIMQDLAQEMLGLSPRNDYAAMARNAAEMCRSRYAHVIASSLELHQVKGTRRPPLEDFAGSYTRFGATGGLIVDVRPGAQDGLELAINGHFQQAYHMVHYHYDTWSLLPSTNDECLTRGFFSSFDGWEEFLVTFGRRAEGSIGWFAWKLEGVSVRFERIIRDAGA